MAARNQRRWKAAKDRMTTPTPLPMKENFGQAISEYRKLASKELSLLEAQPSKDIGTANSSEVNGRTRLSIAVDWGAGATVANPEFALL